MMWWEFLSTVHIFKILFFLQFFLLKMFFVWVHFFDTQIKDIVYLYKDFQTAYRNALHFLYDNFSEIDPNYFLSKKQLLPDNKTPRYTLWNQNGIPMRSDFVLESLEYNEYCWAPFAFNSKIQIAIGVGSQLDSYSSKTYCQNGYEIY